MSSPLRILIVEDEALAAMRMEIELVEAGFEIFGSVASGEEAIEFAKTGPVDVILMDIGLADQMNGIEAARQIRAFSQVPIIFTTGYADAAIRESAMVYQPASYIVKPMRISDVKTAIDLFMANGRSFSS